LGEDKEAREAEMSDQAPDHENAGNAGKTAAQMREVRLGLVCYGGVSLAIYMHGVTKELYKLVRAARAFERAYAANGCAATGNEDPDQWLAGPADSERAYFAALAALAANDTPLTVTVDVIAGTSAGGINGVCLARGLAEGRSLDGFRNLWLVDADMEDLLAGHALFPWGRVKMLSKLAESAARLGWHHEAGLLDGDLMSRLLYQALDGMARVGDSLIPADESLDLFVTTTNVYGYDTAIPTGAGGISHTDRSYRQLLSFHYDPPPSGAAPGADAGFGDVPALAFAARATASFPGAFPPVSLATFVGALGDQATAAATDQIAGHFAYGLDYGATETGQWFMDGGVLDNGPFDHVLDAIAAKRADGPTAREIIYIEPDPGPPPQADQHAPDPEPSFAKTVWAARITIPQHTPLVGVLSQLEAMNAAIAEAGAIVQAQEAAVLDWLGRDDPSAQAISGRAGYADVTGTAARVRQAAEQLAGPLGYATYARLRAQAVAEAIGASLTAELRFPAESNGASFVVAVFCAWARQQTVWQQCDPDALEAQLGAVDIPFRLRRAQFVLQGINALFATAVPEMRPQLSALKSAAWDLITSLRACQKQVAADVCGQARELFGPQALTQEGCLANPETFAGAGTGGHGAELSALYRACLAAVAQHGVTGSSQDLWQALTEQTRTWDPAVRTLLLSRYVGFPIWDALIFPVVALARLPLLTPVSVQRFSPLDATCLAAVNGDGTPRPDRSAKLDGTAIRHFGAFFDKAWRENDYLWGRLDGAELAMRLLSRQAAAARAAAGQSAAGQSAAATDLTGMLRSALTAILDTEQPGLGQIGPVCRALAAQVSDITTMGPNGPAV
jgi:patatin-related protein